MAYRNWRQSGSNNHHRRNENAAANDVAAESEISVTKENENKERQHGEEMIAAAYAPDMRAERHSLRMAA